MIKGIYDLLVERKQQQKKSFAVLIDPDKVNDNNLLPLINMAVAAKVDYFLVGGSLVISNYLDACVQLIKRSCDIPVILFPGSPNQVSKYADALLYLSLISGRNADMLIGQHVISAPIVKQSGLETSILFGTANALSGGNHFRFFSWIRLVWHESSCIVRRWPDRMPRSATLTVYGQQL